MTPTKVSVQRGKVVTFYSYKGGTGRSMAVANVAWLLASSGYRVLAIDWDLEAPGLHQYFEPFLSDGALERSTGIIDFILSFATAAVSEQPKVKEPSWFLQYSGLLAHAMPVQWDFPGSGTLDFVPAGRQDASYANRVNSFNWQNFYEILGGGILLEAVKQNLRQLYDFILVDSRTGVSDTSGVCTVQMPDELVVCFTLNRQSIYGAAAAARSAWQQRKTPDGQPVLKIWPVPMRIEVSEKERLEFSQTLARTLFSGMMQHVEPARLDDYWGEISVGYEPYYAYEEILAVFRDRPRQVNSVLSRMQGIAERLVGTDSLKIKAIDETNRAKGLAEYTSRSARDYIEELRLLAEEYESIRKKMPAGDDRTEQMTLLVQRAKVLGGRQDTGEVAERLFTGNTDGERIVGLALARAEPQRRHVNMALAGISQRRSPFEQFHALLLVKALLPILDPGSVQQVHAAVEKQIGTTITEEDRSRWNPAQDILASSKPTSAHEIYTRASDLAPVAIGSQPVTVNECSPSASFVRYEDVQENHGPFVVTRGVHQVQLPPTFRMAKYLVTNELFMEFVADGGYNVDNLWTVSQRLRKTFLTADGTTMGPASWPNAFSFPKDKPKHPVSGVCFLEAQGFANWANRKSPLKGGWKWVLPPEDFWEFAARGEAGLIYPWGDAFDSSKCNSAESAIGGTSDTTRFESGASPVGCLDMAGNLWEFVIATDMRSDWCALRGGSYKNTASQVRSYLRLVNVWQQLRPEDFGIRLTQVKHS